MLSIPLAQTGLSATDYTVVLVYMLIVLGLGAWFSRDTGDTESYLLGGRAWPGGSSVSPTLLRC